MGGPAGLLHTIFAEAVAAAPQGVAVDVPPADDRPQRTTLTYAQLDATSSALAVRLRSWGRGERVVAVLLPRTGQHLYVAQLGALKAGAAFTCIDPAFPEERIAFILRDSGAVGVLTSAAGLPLLARVAPALPALDLPAWEREQATLPPRAQPSVAGASDVPATSGSDDDVPSPERLAYVIYTSGTTGRPKGVMIEHRSITNLVRSDQTYFGLGPQDRVAQSSCAAYDSSLEETWLAWGAAATLVVADDDTVRLGPDLIGWLQRERISVLCPPPTLLRMTGCRDPRAALPELRLLYVGGEELPDDVVRAWAPGRWLENGYGPTECTVTVVRARVRPGAPVTIGRPVEGNTAYLLDEHLEPVASGAEGELCIGGAGVARGYLGRPVLTAERFVEHPTLGRIYRTGDLVRLAPDGALIFCGRRDGQVKLRGYRVELGAIEAHLAACPGVAAAACRVQSVGAVQELVAYVVAQPGASPDPQELTTLLAGQLPQYMIPTRFGALDVLPTGAASGKLDRSALPWLGGAPRAAAVAAARPQGDCEEAVARAFGLVLPAGLVVGRDDDFFVLGGTSLLAALVVSELRQDPRTAAATVRDLYELRTVAALAARLGPLVDGAAHTPEAGAASTSQAPGQTAAASRRGAPAPGARPVLVTLAQTGWLLAGLFAAATLAYLFGFVVFPWALRTLGLIPLLFAAPPVLGALGLLSVPFSLAAAVACKWALIGRYRAGRYPVWGSYYLRHWMVQRVVRLVPWGLVHGTVWYGLCLRALGAHVGQRLDVQRGVSPGSGGWDLLDIGDDVTLGRDAALRLVDLVDGHLVVGPIRLEHGATLETRAGVAPGGSMGAGSCLAALAMLPAGAHIPAGERWDGIPARKVGAAQAPEPPDPARRRWSPVGYSLRLLGARWLLGLVLGLPGWALLLGPLLAWQITAQDVLRWLYRPQTGALTVWVLLALAVVAAMAALPWRALVTRALRSVRAGPSWRWGPEHLLAWLKVGQVEGAGLWLSGTLLWPLWLRLAGMRVGPGCEISTIMDVVPELVSVAPDCFFADGIYLGGPRVSGGVAVFGETRLSSNTFLGNHAIIPGGSQLPADILLGVCTVARPELVRPGTSWFGHPCFELPRRDVVACDRSLTHDPPWYRWWTRLIWELARFLLPVAPLVLLGVWFKTLLLWKSAASLALFLGVVVPGYAVALLAALGLGVLAAKWALLGRVRAGQHPLWSCWCSRWDFLYVLWAAYARPAVMATEGTLLLGWWLRAMGCSVGRRVVLGGGFAQVVDPDMLRFDDGATVACMFQAHTFEDRVLKIGPLRLGAACTAGTSSLLFYGADVGAGAHVAEHSVVMKHERLLPGGYYVGAPTRSALPPAGSAAPGQLRGASCAEAESLL